MRAYLATVFTNSEVKLKKRQNNYNDFHLTIYSRSNMGKTIIVDF
jgi:hypothetical protein